MKKKSLTITLFVTGAVVALVLLLFTIIHFSGSEITIARCVVTDSNGLYMVYDERPVHLSFTGNKEYETGDNLLIVHQSSFAESYPEQTRTYFIMKIGSGSEKDIPQKVIDILKVTGNYDISYIGGADAPQTTYSTVKVLETISSEEESSYQVGGILPGTDFSSLGQTLEDKITQEWNTYDSMTREQQLLSSKLWGVVGIQTETWKECEKAIGFTIHNPLETLEWLNKVGHFGMESTDPDTEIKHVQATANTTQTADRKASEINVTAGYNKGSIRITLDATISANTEMYTVGNIYNGYVTYEQNTMSTGSGIPVLVVTINGSNNLGYYGSDYFDSIAYWVKDNVFYSLRVWGEETNKAEIQAILERILEEI